MGKRLFTKSAFSKALECPTKLFYLKKQSEYANQDGDNEFLKALARGGFQVGELARCYFPHGHLVETLDHEEALKKTDELLKQDEVIIFEAAFKFGNHFVRVDIFRKSGNQCGLLEVKSKSADPRSFQEELWNKNSLKRQVHDLKDVWYKYLYDVAFQTFVCRNARSDFEITPYLVCADKTTTATIDGLNQKFLIRNNNGKKRVEIKGDVSLDALGKKILCELDVSEPVEIILSDREMSMKADGLQFQAATKFYSEHFVADQRIPARVGKLCKTCEFRSDENGLKSGFHECWFEATKLTKEQLARPMAYDVWKFTGADELIKQKRYFLTDVMEQDIEPEDDPKKRGLSQSQRQWLQVKIAKEGNKEEYLDREGLQIEMEKWKYPLHFIDFETCTVAIPFSKGRRPYEQIAFQFSHHTVQQDGRIDHAGQYINVKPGMFPNFEFIRALKKELQGDDGTVFRYHNHENTVLNQIRSQLAASNEPDKDELISWIKTLTTNKVDKWVGPRNMVDLCDLVIQYYFHPATKGSNSIKKVLPAILSTSKYLQEKYSRPIYGKHGDVTSLNFENQSWIEKKDNLIIDPYKKLPKIFDEYDRETLDLLFQDDELADGGAAMTAYAYLQFSEMSPEEREKIRTSLLKYCELDTFAMVLIFEYWKEALQSKASAAGVA